MPHGLQSLLRERLATLALPEPVRRCELRGGALTERTAREHSRCGRPVSVATRRASEMPALIEHLRARLGADAVYGLRPRAGTPARERLARGGARTRARS